MCGSANQPWPHMYCTNPVDILLVAIYAQGVFHLNTWKMKIVGASVFGRLIFMAMASAAVVFCAVLSAGSSKSGGPTPQTTGPGRWCGPHGRGRWDCHNQPWLPSPRHTLRALLLPPRTHSPPRTMQGTRFVVITYNEGSYKVLLDGVLVNQSGIFARFESTTFPSSTPMICPNRQRSARRQPPAPRTHVAQRRPKGEVSQSLS